MVLAAQISWSESMEQALQAMSTGGDKNSVENVLKLVQNTLNVLADSVLHEQPPVRRKKLESLVSQFIICSDGRLGTLVLCAGRRCKWFMPLFR